MEQDLSPGNLNEKPPRMFVGRFIEEVLVSSGEVLQAPDLHPEGWICRKGPHGRYHWHHRSLGLAPWEEEDMPRSSTGKKSKGPSLPRADPGVVYVERSRAHVA
eukprot:g2722.t1